MKSYYNNQGIKTKELMEYSGKLYGRVNKGHFLLMETTQDVDNLKQLNKELTEALEKAQHDINWMLNNRQFLNQDCFNYLEKLIAKSKSL